MPTFELTGPDGGTYNLDAPDEHAALDAFQTLHGGSSQPAPVSANNVARSVASGVPIVGGLANKLDAATNAALAPILNPLFADKDQLKEPTFGERYAHSMRDQQGMDQNFEQQHPIVDTAAKLTGGVASMAPVMAAAPGAFGLTGTVPQMVAKGAASGAALSGADAVARGENPVSAAETGGLIGGAAGPVGRVIGKGVAAIADRIRPPPVEPQNIATVGSTEIPLSQSQVTQNPAASAEEQILLRGGRGDAAQANAQGFKDLQDSRVDQARGNIAASLDPTGATAGTAPQDAAEKIAAELISQEQAKQLAQAQEVTNVDSTGQRMAHAMDEAGQLRAATPFDAGEKLSDSFATARNAAKADYRGKYDLTAEQPGEFEPGSAAGFRNDVANGLANSDRPVTLDSTTPFANKALGIVDQRMNAVGPGRSVPMAAAPEMGAAHAQNVADIRAKFGDDVAAAYDRQKQAASTPPSLLQFIASKGGLKPDPELDAIGLANGHRAQIPGQSGFFGVVGKNGADLDRMREAAEEAGYLRGENGATSTPADFLDAIDGELRGQKRYPEGFEGHETKREGVARGEREQYEQDQTAKGFEDDLASAGHGELGPDIKRRAVHLMANEGMHPDEAVEHALAQLDQEDAAGGATSKPWEQVQAEAQAGDRALAENRLRMARGEPQISSPVKSSKIFPGDTAVPPPSGSGFTMRDVDQVRKEINALYGDARRSMMGGGSGSDVYALEHIRDQFDARIEKMVADGKFSGDGPAVLKMQQEARASFADYKQKFAKRGSGDEVGAAVEKILGKFSDTKATPDTVVNLAYGSASSPGGQMPVQIAQRILKIFGKNSEEFATYKQGLFAHLRAGEPEKAAARIDEFLNGTKGKLLAQTAFEPGERIALAKYADRLRGIAPKPNEPGAVAAAVRRYTGADGGPPASANKIISDLMGGTGKGTGANAPLIASHLKQVLSPEGWTALRQGMWEKLTNAGEGKIPFEAQALSQRLHEFLNEGGSQLSKVLFSDQERNLMQQLASVYKRMIPVKGTTNPSGTAPMLAKIAGGARHALLPLLGFSHGGLPGAGVALALDKGITAMSNAKAARNATKLFYGAQKARAIDPRFALTTGIAGQASTTQR